MRSANGGRVDRSKAVSFSFDGKRLAGFVGDTLASALLANGIHLTGRSFKYHRPRGILGAGVEEPNALVNIDRGNGRTDPNQRATVVPLYEGLVATSQNRWPSLGFDVGAINDFAAPVIPAGFYYKTFMWPRRAWEKWYEPRIRRAAGLGTAPAQPDPDGYAEQWVHCDLLIAGAGPAGLAAALAAARDGKQVILCDEQEEFGGSLLSQPGLVINSKSSWDWLSGVVAKLVAYPNITLLPRTTAFSYGHDNMLALAERLTDHQSPDSCSGPRERRWMVRARRVILATGAIERPIVFPNNDRPAIMLASAAATYAARYGVLAGRKVVACVEHDSGYDAAFRMADAGAGIAAIVDVRSGDGPLQAEAHARGIEIVRDAPVDTRGRRRVRALRLASGRWIDCDLITMAGGWTPSLHLFSQSRGRVAWAEQEQMFLPGEAAQDQQSVGACQGSFDLSECLHQGWIAGGGDAASAPASAAAPVGANAPLLARDHAARAFVDFQNDVTAKDIALAVREGFTSVEHIKRYTTTGMATDQGRTSNINTLAIAARTLGRAIPEIGLTTFRAPYSPISFGTMAGHARGALFDPARTTPTHDWATAQGAVFEDVGQWKRARYFPKPGEDMQAAVNRECLAVREAVGVFDASTLGKIEVVGPDAAEFLNRLYINSFTKLGVGRLRYGIMLREDGFIVDDGVIGRIAEDRFHVMTTTGGAANVLHMMEDFRQTEFPDLKLWLTSTTEQWATMAVQGPFARQTVERIVDGIDIGNEAFPHLSHRDCQIGGVAGRLWRVSFTGELGYELNVPSSHGGAIWEALLAAGKDFGVTPYGTETMHVLRAEKGYIIVGQETDGTVTADDAGLSWAIGKAKPDFVGKRALDRAALEQNGRKQLVGMLSRDGRTVIEEGAQIVDPHSGTRAIGHVTSSYWSAVLGHPLALALVENGRAHIGSDLGIAMPDRPIEVRIVDPVFIDPEGGRLHV